MFKKKTKNGKHSPMLAASACRFPKNCFKESRFLHHTAMMAHRCVKKKTEKKAVHKRKFGLRKPTLKNIRPLTEMSLTYAYSANVRKVFHIPKRNDIFFEKNHSISTNLYIPFSFFCHFKVSFS